MGFDISLILFCFWLVSHHGYLWCLRTLLFPFFFLWGTIFFFISFFFYFIASWKGSVLGCICTGCLSFTWGVVYFTVSRLFGFSVSPFQISSDLPTIHMLRGIRYIFDPFIPSNFDVDSHYYPHLICKNIFPMTKTKKKTTTRTKRIYEMIWRIGSHESLANSILQ